MTEALEERLEHLPDARLIAVVREGDRDAFGVLYQRHLRSANRAAACLVSSAAEREDLVAEAFTRVLRMLRGGRGPDEEFRPYLLVTMRNLAIHSATRGAPVSLYADVPDVFVAEAADGRVIDRWTARVAAEAFASLPERWRTVLWHTEVEMEAPATVAPLLGMRPNGVAALAYRAREGLRQAYLRQHMPEPARRECRSTVNKLAGWVRDSVPVPLSRRIARHLDGCAACRARADVLAKVNAELRGVLAPAVLGAPLAAAYLKVPVVVSGAAVGGVAVDAGLGVLTGALLKAGTALAIAATAVTATAAAPPAADPPRGMVADGGTVEPPEVRSASTSPDQAPPPHRTTSIAVPPAATETSTKTAPGHSADKGSQGKGAKGEPAKAKKPNAEKAEKAEKEKPKMPKKIKKR